MNAPRFLNGRRLCSAKPPAGAKTRRADTIKMGVPKVDGAGDGQRGHPLLPFHELDVAHLAALQQFLASV